MTLLGPIGPSHPFARNCVGWLMLMQVTAAAYQFLFFFLFLYLQTLGCFPKELKRRPGQHSIMDLTNYSLEYLPQFQVTRDERCPLCDGARNNRPSWNKICFLDTVDVNMKQICNIIVLDGTVWVMEAIAVLLRAALPPCRSAFLHWDFVFFSPAR